MVNMSATIQLAFCAERLEGFPFILNFAGYKRKCLSFCEWHQLKRIFVTRMILLEPNAS